MEYRKSFFQQVIIDNVTIQIVAGSFSLPNTHLLFIGAVDPVVMYSNPGSANCFSDDWQKSLWLASFLFDRDV